MADVFLNSSSNFTCQVPVEMHDQKLVDLFAVHPPTPLPAHIGFAFRPARRGRWLVNDNSAAYCTEGPRRSRRRPPLQFLLPPGSSVAWPLAVTMLLVCNL